MPYGKGTYGTKRGRPPVKKEVKKMKHGGKVVFAIFISPYKVVLIYRVCVCSGQ